MKSKTTSAWTTCTPRSARYEVYAHTFWQFEILRSTVELIPEQVTTDIYDDAERQNLVLDDTVRLSISTLSSIVLTVLELVGKSVRFLWGFACAIVSAG